MSHHIYTTESVIISGAPVGEANRLLFILTRDFGLIAASVQAVRAGHSKLKGSLQDFSYSRIALVKGKSMWRITSAEFSANFYTDFKKDPQKLALCANVLRLLAKLCPEEEKNEDLFDSVLSAFSYLARPDLSVGEIGNLERVLNLRILHHLGYGSADIALKPFWEVIHFDKEILAVMEARKKEAVAHINKALKESHLS